MKISKKSLHLSEIALLIYVYLLPIEDFFLQDVIGSTSRIAAGVMIFLYFFLQKRIIWSIGNKLFVLYFFWAGLSVLFWAKNPDYYSIIRLFMWMLTTVVIANIIYRNISIVTLIFKTYILSSLYLVVVALVNFIRNSATDLERVDVKGMNQNLLASHFIICIAYLLYNYFKKQSTFKTKVLFLCLIFLFFLGIIASGSRSALLSVFICFLLLAPMKLFLFKNLIQIIFIFLIGYLFLNSDNAFTQLLSERISASVTDNGGNRLIIWKVALTAIVENPILGVGYRNFPSEYGNYLALTSLDNLEELTLGEENRAAHNTILETLSELGLIGLLIFYGFQYKLYRSLKINKLNNSLLLIVILITINVNSLFGDLVNLKYFWLIVAMGFGLIFADYKYNSLFQKSKY